MTENTLELEVPPPETGNSFTALLELPPNKAMELLHQEPVSRNHTAISAMEFGESTLKELQYLSYAPNSSPIFISNMDLIDRAARFSNFANIVNGDYISEMNFIPSNSTEVKKELTDSESNHSSSPIFSDKSNQSERKRSTKRKLEGEQKVKVSAGKSKRVGNVEDCKQLPYVHVRARRGQATDSHSLAERARREKINAKMKLLQEMVPGCAKITGTASVLDEIINHVQSLQHQVEILSMRLAAVNPRIDYNLDSLMVSQSGGLTPSSFASSVTAESSFWPGIQMNNITGHQYLHDLNQPHHQQVDMFQQPLWERETNQSFITSPENSVYSYNSTNSVALHPNQLKMEM